MPYELFEGSYVYPLGQTLTIVALKDMSARPVAELFVLAPDDGCWFAKRRFRYDPAIVGFLGEGGESVETIVVEDCLKVARGMINSRILELRATLQPRHLDYPTVELRPAQAGAIVSLRMRGKCFEQLQEVMQVTEVKDLASLLYATESLNVTRVEEA